MTELEVTWDRTLKVWWSLAWRAVLFGFLGGFVIGFVVGFLGGLVGAEKQVVMLLYKMAALIAFIPIGIWVVKVVLIKRFPGFRIALIQSD